MFRKSGVLHFILSGGNKTLCFQKGEIVYATSTFPEEEIGEILYRLGKFDRDILQGARQFASGTIPLGKARIAREGTDVTIVTYGNAVGIAEQAAAQLEDNNVSVEVIDLRTIKPWDEQCVLDSIEKTGRLVVVHEAAKSGGFGAEIIATVMEKAGYLLETPPVRVAHADMPWAVAKLEPFSMISSERIAIAVRKVMED